MPYLKSVLGAQGATQLIDSVAAVDGRVTWSDPLMGEWWIDPSKCYYDRLHPVPPDPKGWTPLNRGGVRPTSGAGGIGVGKWAYVPEGEGVRTFYYFGNGPDSPALPMMQYFATWDGTPWADPHSTLLPGQLAQVWRLDPHLIVRLVLDNKSPVYQRWEWAVWASSTDGRTFACTSWDAADPDRHNLQVFDKHLGSIYDSHGTGAPAIQGLPGGAAPPLDDVDLFLGEWVLDLDRSSFLRGGQDSPDAAPSAAVIRKRRIDRDDEGGLREQGFATPDGDVADVASVLRLDGIDHPASADAGPGDTGAAWKIAPELIVRRVRGQGGGSEWSLYAASGDGGTLAVTSWSETSPHNRDIQVFRKVAAR